MVLSVAMFLCPPKRCPAPPLDGSSIVGRRLSTGPSQRRGGFLEQSSEGVCVAILAAAVSLVAAVSAFGGADTATATTVNVTAGKPTELHFVLSKKTIVKGTTTFKVTNKGTIDHNFKIAGKKTMLIKAGKTATLKVMFTKTGKFPFLCTVPAHAAGGMKGTLTVKTT